MILDLSTGTGIVARMVAELGASEVVGVHINKGMLGKAKEIIAADASVPKDVIELELGDVFAPLRVTSADPGYFDVVAGISSLNYLPSRDSWPGLDEHNGWYGIGKKIIEEVEDGYRIRTISLTNPPLEFDNFDLDHSVYFKAGETAGPKNVKTDAKEKIAPSFKDGEDQAYWDKHLERPLFDQITAK